eukprot:TRINITY_DN8809_c0_g1_i2.p1 TRINITY_DN8809_c0_g1~~TRINITY_DN8809_c0_g1_i2.p1  ORF type:complete len:1211 (-),score=201.20 TRINITY_DN8809_c0_g1_i2:60-3692(-)
MDEPSPLADYGENVFAVERLLNRRRCHTGGYEYLVRWQGYNSDYDTWEREENMFSEELISEYLETKNAEKDAKEEAKLAASVALPPVSTPTVPAISEIESLRRSALGLRSDPAMKMCQKLLTSLKKHHTAHLFLHPVDPKAFDPPLLDYFDVIHNPMDLTTIQLRLDNSMYTSADAFFVDVRLVFNNCITYNGIASDTGRLASDILQKFERERLLAGGASATVPPLALPEPKQSKHKKKEDKPRRHGKLSKTRAPAPARTSTEPSAASPSVVSPGSADLNDEHCDVCKFGGDLLCCESCPRSFHLECVGLEDLPPGSWFCRQCLSPRASTSLTPKKQPDVLDLNASPEVDEFREDYSNDADANVAAESTPPCAPPDRPSAIRADNPLPDVSVHAPSAPLARPLPPPPPALPRVHNVTTAPALHVPTAGTVPDVPLAAPAPILGRGRKIDTTTCYKCNKAGHVPSACPNGDNENKVRAVVTGVNRHAVKATRVWGGSTASDTPPVSPVQVPAAGSRGAASTPAWGATSNSRGPQPPTAPPSTSPTSAGLVKRQWGNPQGAAAPQELFNGMMSSVAKQTIAPPARPPPPPPPPVTPPQPPQQAQPPQPVQPAAPPPIELAPPPAIVGKGRKIVAVSCWKCNKIGHLPNDCPTGEKVISKSVTGVNHLAIRSGHRAWGTAPGETVVENISMVDVAADTLANTSKPRSRRRSRSRSRSRSPVRSRRSYRRSPSPPPPPRRSHSRDEYRARYDFYEDRLYRPIQRTSRYSSSPDDRYRRPRSRSPRYAVSPRRSPPRRYTPSPRRRSRSPVSKPAPRPAPPSNAPKPAPPSSAPKPAPPPVPPSSSAAAVAPTGKSTAVIVKPPIPVARPVSPSAKTTTPLSPVRPQAPAPVVVAPPAPLAGQPHSGERSFQSLFNSHDEERLPVLHPAPSQPNAPTQTPAAAAGWGSAAPPASTAGWGSVAPPASARAESPVEEGAMDYGGYDDDNDDGYSRHDVHTEETLPVNHIPAVVPRAAVSSAKPAVVPRSESPPAKRSPDSNDDLCTICRRDGELICCDGCPGSFHLKCCKPPLKAVPEGEWWCWMCKPRRRKLIENQRLAMIQTELQLPNGDVVPLVAHANPELSLPGVLAIRSFMLLDDVSITIDAHADRDVVCFLPTTRRVEEDFIAFNRSLFKKRAAAVVEFGSFRMFVCPMPAQLAGPESCVAMVGVVCKNGV